MAECAELFFKPATVWRDGVTQLREEISIQFEWERGRKKNKTTLIITLSSSVKNMNRNCFWKHSAAYNWKRGLRCTEWFMWKQINILFGIICKCAYVRWELFLVKGSLSKGHDFL